MDEWEAYEPVYGPGYEAVPPQYSYAPQYPPKTSVPTFAPMAPAPWEGPSASNSTRPWRFIGAVLTCVLVLFASAALVLTTSRTTTGRGTAFADASQEMTTQALPDGSVRVRYPTGHFQADFTEIPTRQTTASVIAGIHVSLHAAVVQGQEMVACAESARAIPGDDYGAMLEAAAASFSTGSGLETVDEEEYYMRDRFTARHVTYTRSGQGYELVVFIGRTNRIFFIFAEQGTQFATLRDSWLALP